MMLSLVWSQLIYAQATTSDSLLADGEEIYVTRGDLEGGDGTPEVQARAVLTLEDLRAYAETVLRNDESVAGLKFTSKSVAVKYKQIGHFLALLPVTFQARAEVYADGNVVLDYPWYGFLTVDSHSEIETQLRIVVDNALRSRAVGSVVAASEPEERRFDASQSAEAASQVIATFKASLESVTHQASTKTNVENE